MLGVPHNSVLGPLFYNILVNDFGDGNTVYACDKSVESMVIRLEDDITRTLDPFKDKRIIANPKKCRVMFLGRGQHQEFLVKIEKKID